MFNNHKNTRLVPNWPRLRFCKDLRDRYKFFSRFGNWFSVPSLKGLGPRRLKAKWIKIIKYSGAAWKRSKKTFPENPQRGQLLDFYKNKFCFVWRPAPRHTVPSTAPLLSEPGFRFVPSFETSTKRVFVLCGAPPRTTPSPAPLRSLRAWGPFRESLSFETSIKTSVPLSMFSKLTSDHFELPSAESLETET